MANIFRVDTKGAIQRIKNQEYPGMFWGILLWQDLSLDIYIQYFAGSPWGGRGLWFADAALAEAVKKGGLAIKRFKTAWPMGTCIGIKTMNRTGSPAGSLRRLDVPIVAVRPDFFGGGVGELSVETVRKYAPNGFVVDLVIFGTYYNRVGVEIRTDMAGREYVYRNVITEQFGAPACGYSIRAQPADPSIYFIQLTVGIKDPEGNIPEIPQPVTYRLIHQKKINAEIYPPHNTILSPGQQVHIIAEPNAERLLTEFTVQGADKLAEATRAYTGGSLPGITLPYGYDDPTKAKYTYGPVTSDVYVTAVAEGVEIEETVKAGVEQTIQMTTTDCFVENDSWQIVGTDLPGSTEYSIDANGLISLFIPEDVYEGNPGGVYYLDVEFHGYSQEKSMRLWLTVEEVAAYGTVWNEAASLPEIPAAVFEDSNQNLYVTTPTKILLSTDAENFEEMTLTGTRTGSFGNVVEGPNGRLLVAETKGRIWIKDPEDEGFIRQDGWDAVTCYWGNEPVWLSAHPLSDVFLQGGTNDLGFKQRITARHTTTGDVLHVLEDRGVYQGHANPGVLLSDGSWLITYPGVGGSTYKVYRYTPGVGFAELISGTADESENLLFREASGKVILLGGKTSIKGFIRSTENNGQTWSSETLVPKVSNERIDTVCSLKKDTLVFGGSTTKIHRSTDLITTYTTVKALPGPVQWILKRRSGVLIALSKTDSNVNVWKSEA
jgi:hypothetical protein